MRLPILALAASLLASPISAQPPPQQHGDWLTLPRMTFAGATSYTSFGLSPIPQPFNLKPYPTACESCGLLIYKPWVIVITNYTDEPERTAFVARMSTTTVPEPETSFLILSGLFILTIILVAKRHHDHED